MPNTNIEHIFDRILRKNRKHDLKCTDGERARDPLDKYSPPNQSSGRFRQKKSTRRRQSHITLLYAGVHICVRVIVYLVVVVIG